MRIKSFIFLPFLLSISTSVVEAQSSDGGGIASGGLGTSTSSAMLEGMRIQRITISFKGGGDEAQGKIKDKISKSMILSVGSTWDSVLAEADLKRINAFSEVKLARFIPQIRDGEQGFLQIEVTLEESDLSQPMASGLLVDPKAESFPTLYRKEDTYLKIILGGGVGLHSDLNPWFGDPAGFTTGSPLVDNPALGAQTSDQISWIESYIYFGLGGLAPISDKGLYAFGAATAIAPTSTGDDIFSSQTRGTINEELLYAGLLYSPNQNQAYKLSVGRQNFSLNKGFLISQYASQSNAGPRPGVYTSPRTALDFSMLASARYGAWSAQGFYLDANEYEPLESDTIVAGFNVGRTLSDLVSVDASVITVTQSRSKNIFPDSSTGNRAGVWTLAGHIERLVPTGRRGFWFESELAHQWHEDYDMSAWAGYGLIGYYFRGTLWTPSLSYRYAHFSGDDPNTKQYERFDTLYSGGLNYWLQGIQINKVLRQANRNTHRIELNVSPNEKLDLTLGYYVHTADEKNNRGGGAVLSDLQSDDLGQEVQFVARWSAFSNAMIQCIVSTAFPGDAITSALPNADEPWTTFQAQLYWGF